MNIESIVEDFYNVPNKLRKHKKQTNMKTTYPDNPIKDFNEWREFIGHSVEDIAADKFEKDFARIWSDFKSSVIKARTL